MGSLLAALTTIVVTVLAALLAVPYIVDWNDYRSAFEAQAAHIVGRPVRIVGNIDLTILPVPVLKLRGLRIADEYGKFDKPFADVEGLNVVLALPPLLSGTLEAKTIELDQPVLRLKIDEFGEGTWQSIGPHGLDIPLPVREVILHNVEITGGAVELRNGQETVPRRIDRISGSFSADSLTGPFRFAGSATTGGDAREIKLSTGQMKGAALRLKASMRSGDGVSLYQLDGDLVGLDGPIQYVGPVAARLALDADAKTAKTGQLAEPMAGKALELRASSKITLEEARLDDITLTVTQNDRPQSFTGSAFVSWGDIPRLDLTVESGWFDIDQMLRADARDVRPVPGAAIAALPRIFEGWSFTPRQGQIKAKIQQAGLGGDVVEGLNFTASHDAKGWQIETLVARLPGETDIDVKGTLPAGDALGFNGDFTLKGKNLSRLLRWAAPSLGVVDAGNAQNFSLASGMTLSPARLAFREAKGALGDSSFTFDLAHDYGEHSKLLLALESERLDLRGLYADEAGTDTDGQAEPAPAAAAAESSGAATDWTAQTVPSRKTSLADVLQTVFKAEQSNVSLLISQLQLPDFEARDVRSAFRYENGTFDIRELNLASTDGLKVKADGQVTGFDSKPDGAVNLSIDAPSAQSVTNLARLAGLDGVSAGARQRIEALAPFRLKGNLSAVKKESLLKLTLAGNAGGSELSFTGKLSGDLNALREAKVDVTGMIGNADGHRLIAQLAPEAALGKEVTAQAGAGILNVSAVGAMKSGLVSRIELQTPQARGRFEGEIGLLAEPSWNLKGNLNMRAAQAGTALSMLRLQPGGSPLTGAIDLQAAIAKQASKYGVSDLALTIGGETIRGTAEVDMASGRPTAKIDINAASAALPKIAAYLVDWGRQDPTAQIAGAGGGVNYWPDSAFALAALQAVDGVLKLKASTMTLAEELPLADAQLEAALTSGTLTLSRLDGRLYAGKFTASGTLKALQGHAGLDAKLKLTGADLAALTQEAGGKELAKGKADLQLSVRGEGFSPRGLLAALSGTGELHLDKGAIRGLSPAVLKKAAATYMTQEIPEKSRLTAQLDGDFRKGNLGYAPMTVPIEVKDGVLYLRDTEFAGEDYRAKAGLMLALAPLRLDSEWDIAYTGKTEDGQKLPPVQLVFAGPLAGFGNLSAQLSADQFERYLSMKRMDLDMDRLEKLGQQRGPAKAPPVAPRKDSAPVSSAEPPVVVPGAALSSTIPTQSVLHAPPAALEQPGGGPAKAPVQKDAEPPATGWSAGVEESGNTPETAPQQAPHAGGAQTPANFEAQIREVLGNQQRPLGDGYRGGDPQYRTQSYSRGGVKVED